MYYAQMASEEITLIRRYNSYSVEIIFRKGTIRK